MNKKTLFKEILIPQIHLQLIWEKILNKTWLNVFGILSKIPQDWLNLIYDSMLSLWSKYPLSVYHPNPKFNWQLSIKWADRVCEIDINIEKTQITELNYDKYIGQKILPYEIEFDNNRTFVFDMAIEEYNNFGRPNTNTYYVANLSDIAVILIRYFGINTPELKWNIFSKAFPNWYIPPSNVYYSKHEHIDEQIWFMYIKKFLLEKYSTIPNITIILHDHQFENFKYDLHILKDLNITFLVLSSSDKKEFDTLIDLDPHFVGEYYRDKLKELITKEIHPNEVDLESKINSENSILDEFINLRSLEQVYKVINSYNMQIMSYIYWKEYELNKWNKNATRLSLNWIDLEKEKQEYLRYIIGHINHIKTDNPFV